MTRITGILLVFMVVTLMTGCATVPAGPRVMVLPAPGKPFEVFQQEDAICRHWAGQQIGMTQEELNQRAAGPAVAGAAIGAGIGAAIGSTYGKAGGGALIGGGVGLLSGLAEGSERVYGWEAQRRYDIAYMQCMYSKGNHIPGQRGRQGRIRRYPPPPPYYEPDAEPPVMDQPYSPPPMR